MPRSRGSSDVPQRSSPRAPLHLKTSACSEVNGVHRPIVERSPKLEDRRSPRSPLHEVVKKKVPRVADLETKLGKAQEELKKLRDQLASAEAAKVDAEEALEKAKKQIPSLNCVAKGIENEKPTTTVEEDVEVKGTEVATDVFEVVMPKDEPIVDDEDRCEGNKIEEEMTFESQVVELNLEPLATENGVKSSNQQEVIESPEVVELKSKLMEKEKEVEILLEENVIFKTKAKEESDHIMAAARAKEEELVAKLKKIEEELKESRFKTEHLGDQLKASEDAKSTIEADMRRLRVQTDQWRKAAEAAAAVIATGDSPRGIEGRKVSERCGSMDKHLSSGGYAGWGSPLMAGDLEDDGGIGSGGRRKAGIRMFGDLWKKKGQQK